MQFPIAEFLEEQTKGLSELLQNLTSSRVAAARQAARDSAARIKSLNGRIRTLVDAGASGQLNAEGEQELTLIYQAYLRELQPEVFKLPATTDEQGRLLIHPLLRGKTALDGAVAVLGNMNCLDVWNRERFEAKLTNEPLADDHWQMLAGLGL